MRCFVDDATRTSCYVKKTDARSLAKAANRKNNDLQRYLNKSGHTLNKYKTMTTIGLRGEGTVTKTRSLMQDSSELHGVAAKADRVLGPHLHGELNASAEVKRMRSCASSMDERRQGLDFEGAAQSEEGHVHRARPELHPERHGGLRAREAPLRRHGLRALQAAQGPQPQHQQGEERQSHLHAVER